MANAPGAPDLTTNAPGAPTPQPAVGAGPVVPTSAAFDRIARATKYVEAMNRSRTPRQRRTIGAWSNPGVLVQLTSSVGARSGSTVYSGTANVIGRDGGTTLGTTGDTLDSVWNLTDKSVASGAYGVALWADGDWWLVAVGSCTDLS